MAGRQRDRKKPTEVGFRYYRMESCAREGELLLSASRYLLTDIYLMDMSFVVDLPQELSDVFAV